ncbi:MAG: dephospho-CoA kinase [Chloroflexota bacterium]
MTKKIIGLTGNIATGKSAIMKYAAEQGVLTIDADKVVHEIQSTNETVQKQIAEAFGPEIRKEDGSINRPALGAIVFSDPEMMEKLESILHPVVRLKITNMVSESEADLVMVEAIKLLEGPLKSLCDAIWVANCGKLLQFQRLVIARGMDEDEAFKRIATQAAQAPQEEKVAQATLVIETTGTLTQTRDQVMAALSELKADDTPAKADIRTQDTVYDTAPAPTPTVDMEDSEPAAEAEPAAESGADPGDQIGLNITVRRARPSDIPSIMLLIHKATDGKVKPKRMEILESLSERGYLIGQIDTEVSTVAGWYTDKGFSVVEQLYVHPPEAAEETGKAVLSEIRTTANNLLAEAIFAFNPPDTPDFILRMLEESGYITEASTKWPLVWQQTLKELQPEDTRVMVHKLRTMRIL